MIELERFLQKNNTDFPETGLIITIQTNIPEQILGKLSEFMQGVIKVEKSKNKIDELWKKHMPNWFISTTKSVPRDELLTNPQLWDFGSWIDGMKQRGWKLWKHSIHKDKLVIFLETINYPYNIDPFFYILCAMGIDYEKTSIREIYPGSNDLSNITN